MISMGIHHTEISDGVRSAAYFHTQLSVILWWVYISSISILFQYLSRLSAVPPSEIP